MSELTDDQLDGLFRKSAEEFETPFDPAAWQDMNARLDVNDRTLPTGRATLVKNIIRWGLPLIVLLLLVVGVWSVYQQPTKPAGSATPSSVAVKSGASITTPDRADARPATDQPGPEKAGASESITESAPAPGGMNTADNLAVNPKRRASGRPDQREPTEYILETTRQPQPAGEVAHIESIVIPSAPEEATPVSIREKKGFARSPLKTLPMASTKGKTTARQTGGDKRRATDKSVAGKTRKAGGSRGMFAEPGNSQPWEANLITAKRPMENGVVDTPLGNAPGNEKGLSDKAAESSATVALPDLSELSIRPATWSRPSKSVDRVVSVPSDTKASSIVPQSAPMRGLSVRFEVAPDLSTIGLKNFSRPGTNVGLLLEYRLSRRWSVQAGLVQSTKVYSASTSEYTAPPELWKSPFKSPLSVDGRCTMFDIPINVRYDVILKPRSDGRQPTRWFVSGGVTSYIMENEEYYYTYPPHTYNQPLEYMVNSGGYGFSNLNLSVGYERPISRRLSWQIEPFMKVPLRGVGFFKINLLSTGTFFSLRYKL